MERIRVFKSLKGLAKFFIILGTLLTLLSVAILLKSLLAGFNTSFPAGDWNSVMFLVQGILFIIMGYSNLYYSRYYIEWDEKELRYYFPGAKHPESIQFSEIESAKIRLFEIELKVHGSIRSLHLENLDFEDLKRIKNKFYEFRQEE
jgi:hypothetical protein